MVKKWLIVCFCAAGVSGFGQTEAEYMPPFTLKCALLSLMNVAQTSFDVRADIPVAKRWAVEPGAGFIFESVPFALYRNESYRGFKIRPAVKYYFKKKQPQKDTYMSLAFKYHQVWHNEYVFTFRHGEQYTEWMMNKRRLAVWGGTLNFGGQQYVGKKKRVLIESYLGFGWRLMHVSSNSVPADAQIIPNRGLTFYWQHNPPGFENRPDIQIGFCIGWARTKEAKKIELGD